MKDLKVYEDDNYYIKYSPSLEEFIQDEMALANRRRQKMVELFGKDIFNIPGAIFDEKQKKLIKSKKQKMKIKGALFDSRQDFFDYVSAISKGTKKPSDIATGIYCQGQIVGWVDKDKNGQLIHGVLAHETVHVFFYHLATYSPIVPTALSFCNQVSRPQSKQSADFARWFEEAYAYYDEKWSSLSNNEKKAIIEQAKTFLGIDLNDLNDEVGKRNFGSAMRVIGQYIFETGQEKTLFNLFMKNSDKIREIGKTILKDAIEYFEITLI